MTVRTDSRFVGVLKIVRFNIQFYVISFAGLVLVAGILASHLLPTWLARLVALGALVMAFWTLSSLLVSWYVYDFVGVTRWTWLHAQLHTLPQKWVNIHAGLDESTAALKSLFPDSQSIVIDIYDPAEMTEPSIARARRMYPAAEPFLRGTFNHLPLPGGDHDEAFSSLPPMRCGHRSTETSYSVKFAVCCTKADDSSW